jgi:hypothetical protein
VGGDTAHDVRLLSSKARVPFGDTSTHRARASSLGKYKAGTQQPTKPRQMKVVSSETVFGEIMGVCWNINLLMTSCAVLFKVAHLRASARSKSHRVTTGLSPL